MISFRSTLRREQGCSPASAQPPVFSSPQQDRGKAEPARTKVVSNVIMPAVETVNITEPEKRGLPGQVGRGDRPCTSFYCPRGLRGRGIYGSNHRDLVSQVYHVHLRCQQIVWPHSHLYNRTCNGRPHILAFTCSVLSPLRFSNSELSCCPG